MTPFPLNRGEGCIAVHNDDDCRGKDRTFNINKIIKMRIFFIGTLHYHVPLSCNISLKNPGFPRVKSVMYV